MRCILFRHGIAVEWHDWNGEDKDRPLTEEGLKKTQKIALGLLQLQVHPTQILCSPFVRTQQTATILQQVLGFSKNLQLRHELLSEASPENFVHFFLPFLTMTPFCVWDTSLILAIPLVLWSAGNLF